MNKKTLAKWLTALAIVGIATYIYVEWDKFSQLRIVSAAHIGVVVFAVLMNLVVTSLILWHMLRKLALPISLLEAVFLSLISTIGNIVGPFRGGAALRAVYLKSVYGFEFSHFMSTLYGVYVVTIGANASIGLVAVVLMGLDQSFAGLIDPLIALVACMVACFVAVMAPRVNSNGSWLLERLASASDGWHTLRSDRGLMRTVIGLTFLQAIAGVTALWGCFAILGVQPAVMSIAVTGTMGNLSSMLSITPAGLGVYDGVVAYMASKASIVPHVTVAATLLMRLILLAALVPLCIPAIIWLSKKFGANVLRPTKV